MARKVIGIGETILDIIFKNEQPTAAVPGGSVFNGIVSLGRMGVNVDFISEVGNDRVGQHILDFMRSNGVNTEHVCVFPDGKSPLSLAFLDEHNDADYLFYKDYPSQRLDVEFPEISANDIVMYGSYFVLNPQLRPRVSDFLEYARNNGALLYYDINFRATHRIDAIKLSPVIIENLEYADIVRGSVDDFSNLYNCENATKIYKEKISFYCPQFICTNGAKEVSLFAKDFSKTYDVPAIEAISTVGAGDNFNAGVIYGLLKNRIRRDDLSELSERDWDNIIRCGIDFSSDACQHIGNSVSDEFVARYDK